MPNPFLVDAEIRHDPDKIIHDPNEHDCDKQPYDKKTIIEHTKKDTIVAHNKEDLESAWEQIKRKLEAAGFKNVHIKMKCTYS